MSASENVQFVIDDVEIAAKRGQTILEAADAVGIYIPRLCYMKGLSPGGACRVCTVTVNGRPQSACTYPVSPGIMVEHDTPELRQWRKSVVEMLFVEGNHFCMFCEKSGSCELQAMGYRMGITTPEFPYLFPKREVDASHPDVLVDHNRCILCGRCVRASKQRDGKNVFQLLGRGHESHVGVNAEAHLGLTDLSVTDRAVTACPVGAIITKRVGFAVPVEQRLYDKKPIGSDVEEKLHAAAAAGAEGK
jgi:[NiFe] hydrogenase diaphorase moiety small subunit